MGLGFGLFAFATMALTLAFVLECCFVVSRGMPYFPGDPPFLDLAIYPAGAAFVLGVLSWPLMRGSPVDAVGSRRRALIKALVIAASLVLLIPVGGIGFRLTPRWAPIRTAIRAQGDAILAASGRDKAHTLSPQEFTSLRERFMSEPITLQLPGFGAVRLRMAHGVYPYVGVDFGDGMNALFDPSTMMCIYAD